MLAAARTVVVLGVLMQFAGFAKLLFIADYFGAGAVLDAYYLGLVIPTFLSAVTTGTLQAAFVPAYVSARARGEDATARTLANVTLTWLAVALAAMSALLISLRGVAVPLLAQGSDPNTRAALRSAFALLVWSAPLNALVDGGALLLNAEGRFGAAAAAPLANAVAGILVLVVCRTWDIDALVWSLLAGLAVQALVVLVAIRAAAIRLRPKLRLAGAFPQLLGAVALPVVLSVALGNLLPAVIQMLSARVGTGAISAMGYASRLHNSLLQAVILSVSIVLLPHFARRVAQGREAELRATLERLFAATLLFAAGAVVFVAAGGPAAVQLLLERGHFTSADAGLVASVWLALTLGLLGATWNLFLVRLLQAQQRVWMILALNGVLLAAGVIFAYLLLPWGVVGVAVGNSAAYTLVMWLCHRRVGQTLGRILSARTRRFVVRAILLNLVAYAAAVGWARLVADLGPIAVITGQLLLVAVANLLVVPTPPLSVPLNTLLRR